MFILHVVYCFILHRILLRFKREIMYTSFVTVFFFNKNKHQQLKNNICRGGGNQRHFWSSFCVDRITKMLQVGKVEPLKPQSRVNVKIA
jgi:hypothetical protein